MTDRIPPVPPEVAARSRHIPDRTEMRELLRRYFVGPITDDHVVRLAEWFEQEGLSLWGAHRARFESLVEWWGWAWYEEVSEQRQRMDPIDHALLMGHLLWETDVFEKRSTQFPRPKRYWPAELVGVWEQLEPVPDAPVSWHFDPDGAFRSNGEFPAGKRYWHVRRSWGWPRNFSIVLMRDEDDWSGSTLRVGNATESELVCVAEYAKPIRLRRCIESATGRRVVSPSQR